MKRLKILPRCCHRLRILPRCCRRLKILSRCSDSRATGYWFSRHTPFPSCTTAEPCNRCVAKFASLFKAHWLLTWKVTAPLKLPPRMGFVLLLGGGSLSGIPRLKPQEPISQQISCMGNERKAGPLEPSAHQKHWPKGCPGLACNSRFWPLSVG